MLLKQQKVADKVRRRSKPNQHSGKDRVDTPLVTARADAPHDDLRAQDMMRMIIKENKELQMRLERAERTHQGLQLGYDQSDSGHMTKFQHIYVSMFLCLFMSVFVIEFVELCCSIALPV